MGKLFGKNSQIALLLLISLFIAATGQSAEVQEADLFEKAYEYYLAFKPAQAIEAFDEFIRLFPGSSAMDSVIFWRAKSFLQLRKFDEAEQGLHQLKDLYPQSSYAAFAEKELDLLKKSSRAEKPAVKPARAADQGIAAYEARIRKLESERAELDKQLSAAEKKSELTEKGLAKALEDRNTLELKLEELRRGNEELNNRLAPLEKAGAENRRLEEDRRGLEARLKESEEKIRTLTAEEQKRKTSEAESSGQLSARSAEIRKLQTERDALKDKAKRLEGLEKDRKELAAKISELEKKTAEAEARTKQLTEERQRLEANIKGAEQATSKTTEAIAQLEKRLRDSDREKKELEKKIAEAEGLRLKDKETFKQSLDRLSVEKAKLEEELGREKKTVAELSGRGTEKEAAFLKQIKALEAARQELETRDKERKELIAKLAESDRAREDLVKKAAQAEKAGSENRRLEEDRRGLEARLKESEEKIRTLTAEKEKSEQQAVLITREMGAKIQDGQKDWQRLDKYINELKAENETLAATIKDRDRAITEAGKSLAAMEKKAADAEAATKRLSEERQRLEAKARESEKSASRASETVSELEKRRKDSEKEREKKIEELSSRLDRTTKEKAELAAAAEELRGKIREREGLVAKLSSEKAAIENELKEAGNKLSAMKTTGDEQARAEVEKTDLKRRLMEYEKPFVRISGQQHSLASVINHARTSKAVLEKIASGPDKGKAAWRTGNDLEDFISEEILAGMAREQGLKTEKQKVETLSRQYALSSNEAEYLARYLAMERLYSMKSLQQAASDKELRDYYDRNREQFRGTGEMRVRVLSMKFSGPEEIEKGLTAVEMRQEALEGHSFGAIAGRRKGAVGLKEMSLSRLPEWVREKAARLREGEISNIMSSDDEYMIIQALQGEPVYVSFDDVKQEIGKKLAAEKSEQVRQSGDWLNQRKKDVEFLK